MNQAQLALLAIYRERETLFRRVCSLGVECKLSGVPGYIAREELSIADDRLHTLGIEIGELGQSMAKDEHEAVWAAAGIEGQRAQECIETYREINKLHPSMKILEGAMCRAQGEISDDAARVSRTYHNLCTQHSVLQAKAEELRKGMSDAEHERVLAGV